MLALFNLIPGFPLDGGRVLRSIIWGVTNNLRKATMIAGNIGRFVAYGFMGYGLLQVFFLGNPSNGLWMGFIGLFLQNAAVNEMRSQVLRDVLSHRTVEQVISRNVAPLPGDISIQRLVDAHILGSGQRAFAVTQGDEIVGVLSAHHVRRLPSYQWPHVTVAEAMTPLGRTELLTPQTGLWTALKQMEIGKHSMLPVIENGRLVGLLRREDLVGLVRTLSLLEPRLARL